MILHPSRILRTTAFAGAALLAANLGAVSAAAPANAGSDTPSRSSAGSLVYEGEEYNGKCETEELCLYYGKKSGKPAFDMHYSDSKFSDNKYPKDKSKQVDNNSKSYKSYEEEGGDENGDTYYWYVYEKNNYKGDYVCVDPGDKGDFDSDFVKKASSAKVTNDPCEEEG